MNMATVIILLSMLLMISYVDSTDKWKSRLVEAQGDLNVISSKMSQLQKKLNSWTGSRPPMVAFTAILSSSDYGSNLGSKQTIRYNNVITDVGNAYNPKTGIFTVPVSGVYTISVGMMGQPDNEIVLHLVLDGKEMVRMFTKGKNRHELSSQTINLKLSKNQKMWVRRGELGKNLFVTYPYNIFSAALLKEI